WEALWMFLKHDIPQEWEQRGYKHWAAHNVRAAPPDLSPEEGREVGRRVLQSCILNRLLQNGLFTLNGRSPVMSGDPTRNPRYMRRIRAMDRGVEAVAARGLSVLRGDCSLPYEDQDAWMTAALGEHWQPVTRKILLFDAAIRAAEQFRAA